MPTPLENALNAVQTTVTASIVLCVVFATTYPSLATALRDGRAVLHLYTWLQIMEFGRGLPKSSDTNAKLDLRGNIFSPCPKGYELRRSNAGYAPECPYQELAIVDASRFAGHRYEPLTIPSIWPEISRAPIYMYRHGGTSSFISGPKEDDRKLENGKRAEFFDLLAPTSPLPVLDYELMRLETDEGERFVVLQKHLNGHLASYGNKSFLVYNLALALPREWGLARLLLLRAGINSDDPAKLSLEDKELIKFITSTGRDAANIPIFGMSVPVLAASSLFQVVFALVAMWSLGPMRILSDSSNLGSSDRIWILLWPTGSKRNAIEVALSTMSLLFAITPVGILVAQFTSGVFAEFSGYGRSGLVLINLICCSVSVVIFFRLAWTLRRMRLKP
jgi:hypothetical protein